MLYVLFAPHIVTSCRHVTWSRHAYVGLVRSLSSTSCNAMYLQHLEILNVTQNTTKYKNFAGQSGEGAWFTAANGCRCLCAYLSCIASISWMNIEQSSWVASRDAGTSVWRITAHSGPAGISNRCTTRGRSLPQCAHALDSAPTR